MFGRIDFLNKLLKNIFNRLFDTLSRESLAVAVDGIDFCNEKISSEEVLIQINRILRPKQTDSLFGCGEI